PRGAGARAPRRSRRARRGPRRSHGFRSRGGDTPGSGTSRSRRGFCPRAARCRSTGSRPSVGGMSRAAPGPSRAMVAGLRPWPRAFERDSAAAMPDPRHDARYRGPGLLVLADGRVFRGQSFGAKGTTVGELVFNTSLYGYQEIVSDPSYAGQIVCLTAPEIGNVGTNPEDDESDKP